MYGKTGNNYPKFGKINSPETLTRMSIAKGGE
jgi:hypothetical protein